MHPFINLQPNIKTDKPWLVLGKGPTFSRVWDINWNEYYTLGLNHVNTILNCDLSLIVDLDVLGPDFVEKSKKVLVPWHPHIDFKPSKKTLKELLSVNYYLEALEDAGKLYTYNLSTYKHNFGKTWKYYGPIIRAKYFSSEAAFNVLIALGITEIRSLGIDGGKRYAKEFEYLKPLQNKRKNFDDQFKEIMKITSGINYQVL